MKKVHSTLSIVSTQLVEIVLNYNVVYNWPEIPDVSKPRGCPSQGSVSGGTVLEYSYQSSSKMATIQFAL